MRRHLQKLAVVAALAVVAVIAIAGTSGAQGEVTNSDIATGAVNSRTIADGGVRYRDLHSSAVRAMQYLFLQPSVTVRGVIGGDFDVVTGGSCVDNCDWAGYASLPFPTKQGITDSDVLVDNTTWTNGGGQTQPGIDSSESGAAAACTGSIFIPTAPKGKVCIYIAGGDNAQGVKGVSVLPGTNGSRYGFKLVWSSVNAEDTFIDAVWAYTSP